MQYTILFAFFLRLSLPQASHRSGHHRWMQAFRNHLLLSALLAPAGQVFSLAGPDIFKTGQLAAYLPLFPIVASHHEIELVLPGCMGSPQPGKETHDVDPLDQNSEHHLLWDVSQYRHPTRCRDVALPETF